MTIQTLTPGAINYVVRRARTVLSYVDTHLAVHGSVFQGAPIDEAVRHSGTDIAEGAVGAYSIRHGDADQASERQYRESQRKTLPVPGGRQGDIRNGRLSHDPTYFSHRTYARFLPPMVARPARFLGEWDRAGSGGKRHGAPLNTGEALTGAERTFLSRQRAKARDANPEATPGQVEAVAFAALEDKRERDAKAKAKAAERAEAAQWASVDASVLAVAADRGW